ncbi:MAG: undecaprenyldiphospho-muramoylpentapeptide beta-N-acetylglucosaminyltransferase [Elusimicrobiota bacterium]
MQRILIAAGGTGGHLYPGMVLGNELRKRGCKTAFICRKNDPCKQVLAGYKFRFFEIAFHGFPRRISFKIFSFFYLLTRSLFSSFAVINSFQPDVVVGMGGYISFPVALAGYLKRIPVVIHEQNALPGMANRLLTFFAKKIAVSFEDSERFFPRDKTIFTGNPVRQELFSAVPEEAFKILGLEQKRITVLIFGGSQGAVRLNHAIIDTLPFLTEYKSSIQFVHITGTMPGEKDRAEHGYDKHGFKASVMEYLDKIGNAYSVADLIICRAGATTISELTILHKPSILVPFPYATGNHQQMNALNLVKKGNAIMIKEKDLSPPILSGGMIIYIASIRKNSHKIALPKHLPQHYLANTVLEFAK